MGTPMQLRKSDIEHLSSVGGIQSTDVRKTLMGNSRAKYEMESGSLYIKAGKDRKNLPV